MICGLLGATLVARAETSFLEALPKDEFAAAGLQKLSPEELARLDAAVQRFKSGELSAMRQQADAKAQASRDDLERKIAAAEAKAREAEANAAETVRKAKETQAKVAAPGKGQPGWFTALITLKRAGEKPEKAEPLESRLKGDFKGWNGHSIFELENGTRWQQQNATDRYSYSPTIRAPKVRITPASFGGFWLEIHGVNLQVRVVPLELPDQK